MRDITLRYDGFESRMHLRHGCLNDTMPGGCRSAAAAEAWSTITGFTVESPNNVPPE